MKFGVKYKSGSQTFRATFDNSYDSKIFGNLIENDSNCRDIEYFEVQK